MQRTKQLKIFVAGLFGNILEWYDFLLYAYFAPIFAGLFFPSKDSFISLLATFGVFAMGFLIRPIGGMILGHIGDKFGRRIALIITITTITITSFLLACLPTYAVIGVWAPLLLTLLRLLQGIAISGELNSSVTYLLEHTPIKRRALVGSLVMTTALFGIFLAAVVATLIMEYTTTEQLHNWGWRLAYVLGGVLGIYGSFIRLNCSESPEFTQMVKKDQHLPLKQLFASHSKEIFFGVCLTSIMALGNYLLIAFVTSFITTIKKTLDLSQATLINLIALLIYMVFQPFMGMLADKYGRKPIFLMGLGFFAIATGPIFWLINQSGFYFILSGEMLLGFALAPIGALVPTILAEIFPTSVRNSGSLVAYNVSLAIFGGSAPAVALALVHYTNNSYAPIGYVAVCWLLALLGWYYIQETHPSRV